MTAASHGSLSLCCGFHFPLLWPFSLSPPCPHQAQLSLASVEAENQFGSFLLRFLQLVPGSISLGGLLP